MPTVKKPVQAKPVHFKPNPKGVGSISLEGVPLCNTSAQYIPALYTIKMNVDTEKIILFREYLKPKPRSIKQEKAKVNLSRGKYNGYLSVKTASKIRKMLTTWVSGVEVYKTL